MIVAFRITELYAQDRGSCVSITVQKIVRIPICHPNRIGIKVEASPITRLEIGRIISHIDGIVVIDDDLKTGATIQRSGRADT